MLMTKFILTSLYAENPNSPAGSNISFVYIDNVAVGMSHYETWWLIDMAEDGCTVLCIFYIYTVVVAHNQTLDKVSSIC